MRTGVIFIRLGWLVCTTHLFGHISLGRYIQVADSHLGSGKLQLRCIYAGTQQVSESPFLLVVLIYSISVLS